jgi:hypothetical protein
MPGGITKFRTVLTVLALLAVLVLVPGAYAGKGGGGGGHTGGGGGSCTPAAPAVLVQNNWTWGSTGSYGMAGQKLLYQIEVINNDAGCSSSTFTLNLSAPSGFSVSIPTTTVSISSSKSAYLNAYVTSPATATDGDYALTATVSRSSGAAAGTTASATTWYKVYNTDSSVPSVFWPNPGNGNALTGRSYNFTASASDDHAVQRMELYIDGAYVTSTMCDDITYICQIYTTHSLSTGSHSATFKAYDWFGNVGSLTVNYTVS